MRSITIERTTNSEGDVYWNISGIEDFSVIEITEVQQVLGRIAYNDSVNLSYIIDQLDDSKLFKGDKNATRLQ